MKDIITGIYIIKNKINDLKYIGQSVDIDTRFRSHCTDAEAGRFKSPYRLEAAIKEYGRENFYYEILEKCEKSKLNEREIYWIAKYNTFKGPGYNLTPGGLGYCGEDHPRAILTEEQVWNIRELYNRKVPFREAWELYQYCGITKRGFKKVWRLETWVHVHTDVYTPENLEWHATKACGHVKDQIGKSPQDRAYSQELIDKMYKDYSNGMNVHQIAKKYNRDNSTVKKYMLNPKAVTKVNLKGIKVRNIETRQEFPSLSAAGRWAKCSASTVRRHLESDKAAGTVPDTGEIAHWELI